MIEPRQVNHTMRYIRLVSAIILGLCLTAPVAAQSLRFTESRPTAFEFADLPRIPESFGAGEFALELWIKPDDSFPVGEVWAPSYDQLKNWSSEDRQPYSSAMWWVTGNWLLDGFSRPEGFGPGDTREGSIGLQIYGGGRVRFTFADKSEGMPTGGVYAVQAADTNSSPSVLDGEWHHVVAQRRWREPTGATLELWIDGNLIGATDIPDRTDMRRFWDTPAHPDDPPELGGWAFGSEVMTAWNYAVTQFEDYKGLMDDLRFWNTALTGAHIAELARGTSQQDRPAAWFRFNEGRGTAVSDLRGSTLMKLHRWGDINWSQENAPER